MSNTTPQPYRFIDEEEPSWRRDSEAKRIHRLFNSGKSSFPFQKKPPKYTHFDNSGSLMDTVRSIFHK